MHTTAQRTPKSASNFAPTVEANAFGMNERIKRLRKETFEAEPSLSIERALIETQFYRENEGKYPIPILRALNFLEICKQKTIYIGKDELIVGERGPKPKAVPTFPELTCHSVEDLHVLNTRELQRYTISQEDIDTYEREVIPYWKGRTQRERIFNHVPESWRAPYEAGLFTEFMEQRAPGHTALDGKIYHTGLLDLKERIAAELEKLDFMYDPEATDKQEELKAMSISCDAAIVFAERHADLSDEMSLTEKDPKRAAELKKIAEVCRWVPAHAPRTFWEAIQMYWFVHLGTITELNGWDAMNPGHFDQHLYPFYEKEVAAGTLSRDDAKELLSCFWVKVNNHPAPPKVGITAKESGTYNDFTNLNIGGVKPDGSDAVNELSYVMLEIIEELHILQPGSSIHISSRTPERFLRAGCKVIRQGHGYPSVFNPDVYIQELMRQGKTLEDAREGGCSGCIEVGAFGKEAYLLTGYLNVPKLLEVTLNNGYDPVSGKQVSIQTGDPKDFKSYEELYQAFLKQLQHIVDQKVRVSNYIDRMFAKYAPATFLSLFIDDCIAKGKDYYNCGPRYNTTYIQCTGLGTVTDSLSVLKKHVYEDHTFSMEEILKATANNFEGAETMRQMILNRTPFFGNDDPYADSIALQVYSDLFDTIDGKPNTKGETFHLNMLSTTCHVYFGKVLGAMPNGRLAGMAISDGTSPSHGADTHGPSAVIKSLGKLDQVKSGGTLLNLRFLPSLLKREEDVAKLVSLIRSYFALGGHHIQFNIVDTATLYAAQESPEDYRDLLVRMAGYSDYFNDMNADLQTDIISRTEQESF
ncbi:pyruvate formate-lyase/glycerol dehydratase family glycyl radical enzyme [Parabacteroides sp. PF5-5]|nr:pyruvate formate-lyase/glycerol dehydratase family glycyl radical enzyme [Parabacteroides sp. PH5-39]MDH6315475.1 pyruvate formate-lyase/glycerol dehydratase family glycyl radical enzyme [Parabacteroides sp. PF5-13]MDH6319031.1 pyruvate formate-lyase/glycerol dehydratase family glycyl radical enzyme [Parabacteroides sp. PH5-13]MDH6322761.1 pyruvate formate-lyase/glycerol dehydratase family glycyl radical enzyme [Parabacteroides sp. PH5-8]MDH6326667.1 pyruvate formate-lyase/glycerol dehydrata